MHSIVYSLCYKMLLVSPGFALAFITYPEAVLRLPGAPIWAALFFLMLFTLAIDSLFLMMEGIVIAIMDEFPTLFHKRRIYLCLGLCVGMYLLGLPLVTQVCM